MAITKVLETLNDALEAKESDLFLKKMRIEALEKENKELKEQLAKVMKGEETK